MLTIQDCFEVFLQISFAAAILIGVLNREKLIQWEEEHIWSWIRRSGK